MQDGQVKLSQAELEDKAKEISLYKREAPRTLQRYNELIRTQRQMQERLNRLHMESQQLENSRESIMRKIHTLSMGDLVERHANSLPDAMAGALRKSAKALVPVFDYLAIAADTNNRLVDHVGAEIDRYTHVNIASSPFMSGLMFYCVALIPGLTVLTLMRRLVNSSSRLTATHFIILGNFYFLLVCIVNVLVLLILRQDPIAMWFERHEHTFVLANLFLALYYLWHMGILSLQAVVTPERVNFSQVVATLSVGIHYFLFTWRRVFADSAPKMYLFNYMMYATIFCFILYERLGRLSVRQLQENPSFRFVHRLLMISCEGPAFSANIERLRQYFDKIWAALAMATRSPRRFSRRTGIEKRKYRPETREKHKIKHVDQDSNEEEEDESDHIRRRSPDGGWRVRQENHRGRNREPRGFMNFFFGRRENDSESSSSSSSSDSDDQRRHDSPPGAGRSTRKNASERSSRRAGRSIWKWS